MREKLYLPSRYHILSPLGKGSLGEVFKVYDALNDINLALKILSDTGKLKKEILIKEFKTLSGFQHPNLVRVYDFGFISNEIPYFTMELIEGFNLRIFLGKNKNLKLIPLIIKQVLLALSYLHNKKTLHGDIKPENIMMSQTGNASVNVKLLDFGLSLNLSNQQNLISGTIRFLAPEVLSERKYSFSSDFYALGLSLVECITQKNAPIATHINEDYYRRSYFILKESFKNSKLEYPSSISSFILDLAQQDSRDRPQNAEEALQSLLPLSSKFKSEYNIQINNLFVNRKSEIESIKSWFRGDKPNIRTFILEGPKGIGKKSLINKTIYTAQISGYLVLNLSNDHFTDNSLEQFVKLTSSSLPHKRSINIILKHKKILSSINKLRQHKPIDSKRDYSPIIYDNVIQFIHEHSSSQPILICIPDLERFSENFLRFVKHLAYETHYLKSHVLLIASRNVDINTQLNKLRIIHQMITSTYSSVIKIPPLSGASLQKLIKEIFNQELFSSEEINDLLNRTNGIPLFVNEFIKHLVYVGVIQRQEGRWYFDKSSYKDTQLPDRITDILNAPIKGLKYDEKLILQTLAYLGQAADPEIIGPLLKKNNKDIHRNIRKLIKIGIIKESEDGLIHFANPVYIHTVVNQTPAKARRLINNAIADFLESQDSNNFSRMARHYIEAKINDKAVNYGLKAADQMLSKYELYDALLLLSKLKDLLIDCDDKSYFNKITEKIAPLELQLGLTDKAANDYRLLVDRISDSIQKSDFLRQLAIIHDIYWGHNEEARELYKKALYYARKTKDINTEAEILINLGDNLSEKGLKYLKKAAKLIKYSNINLYAKALSKLIHIYKISGNIKEIGLLRSKLITTIDKLDITTRKEILYELHIVDFYRGDYINAKKYIDQMITLDEKTDDAVQKIRSLSSLGGYYYIKGNFNKQINTLNNALVLSRKFNAYLSSLTILSNLSIAYRYLAEYNESLKAIKQAEIIIEEHNISQLSSIYLIKPTKLYSYLGEFAEKQFRFYLEAIRKTAANTKNTIALGHRQLILSYYHYQRLNSARAIHHAQNALLVFEDTDDKDDMVESLSHLCVCFVERDEFKKASFYLFDAVKIFEDIHCEYLKPLLLFAKGSLARITHKENTIELLQEALKASKSMGTREFNWQIQRELAIINSEAGELHESLSYYRDAIETINQISESIDNEDLKLSYLSVPFRLRVFNEVKALRNVQ